MWEGHVSNGIALCEQGWHVCSPTDIDTLQTVTYADATAFPGCFAYDASQDNATCQPCNGDATSDDMAGMGESCGYYAQGSPSCIAGGRVDTVCCADYTSDTACQFKPDLTTGVVCCSGDVVTTTTTSTTSSTTAVPTTTTLPAVCTTAADCDDGDPCNGGEACNGGRCLAARVATCETADPLAVVTTFGTGEIALCNTRTRVVEATIPVGGSPWGVAWRPDGARVFVTNRADASVSVLDVVSRTIIGTVPVGPQPYGIAMHPFLPRVYVTSYAADRVDVIDSTSLTVVDAIKVGDGPAGLVVHPAGAILYVANYIAGTVSAIDVATQATLATVATPDLPVGLALAPDGSKLYVACLGARQVAVIGTVSHTLLRTIRVGRQPIGVAFDATGARAYVTNSADDTVTVIDAVADRAIAKTPVGKFPLGIAVSGDGVVWVADAHTDDLAVLGSDGTVAQRVGVAHTPVAMGNFIGTPPDGCPAAPLVCDDANPYTGDACNPGVGCARTPIPGIQGVRAGVSAIGAIVEASPGDPLLNDVRGSLPALEGAVAAAQTGGDRATLRLVRRSLKPILRTLEAARRKGTLGTAGAQLLDIAREAQRQLKRLARQGGR